MKNTSKNISNPEDDLNNHTLKEQITLNSK